METAKLKNGLKDYNDAISLSSYAPILDILAN